jgi:hypothetical protein
MGRDARTPGLLLLVPSCRSLALDRPSGAYDSGLPRVPPQRLKLNDGDNARQRPNRRPFPLPPRIRFTLHPTGINPGVRRLDRRWYSLPPPPSA